MSVLICPHRELLGEYALGRLSGEQSDDIAEHISGCNLCQQVLRETVEPSDAIVNALKAHVPADPFIAEPERRETLALVRAIGREPSFVRLDDRPGNEFGNVGHYQLLAKLGEGGMGAVYKALHTKLKKVVALKVLPSNRLEDSHAVDRFHREMEAVGKLDHANIVRATDAGDADGTHYLVMELVDGLDLSAIVRRTGPLSPADACELIRQAAVGLQHAARRGLVHRDIKPSNLMLTATEEGSAQVKILDMGLALLNSQIAVCDRNLTSTGQMMGTLDYMAPEQGSDSHQVDIRADIYSLGATLFRLLTGEPPFPSSKYNSPLKLLTALATQSAPSIASRRDDLPPQLVEVVDRMLARDPNDRYKTPLEVAEALTPLAATSNLNALLQTAMRIDEKALQVGQRDVRTGDYLSRPSTGTEVGSDPTAKNQDGHSASRAAELAPRSSGSRAEQPTSNPKLQTSGSVLLPRNLAVAAAFGGIILLGVVTLIFQTQAGTMIVEIDDPEGLIQVTVAGQDILISDKQKNGEPIKLGPGDHKLHVTRGELEFDTDNFTLKRGDTVVLNVKVTARQVQVVRDEKVIGRRDISANESDDPHRQAAEFVLERGGGVHVYLEGELSYIPVLTREELPKGRFTLESVGFDQDQAITDRDLAELCLILKQADHQFLNGLGLRGCNITDEGLSNLRGLTIHQLDLGETKVSDAGLHHLAQIKDLVNVTLHAQTNVTDVGIDDLKQIRSLQGLNLTGTKVTDSGLKKLRENDLRTLTLINCDISNEGLAHVAAHRNLSVLQIQGCPRINDQGLRYLAGLTELTVLEINGTAVSDEGMKYFANSTMLSSINLCEETPYLTETGFAVLNNFPDLQHFEIARCHITDAMLIEIAKRDNLEFLRLQSSNIETGAIAHLQTLKRLHTLCLEGSSVHDADVEHLQRMPQLRTLQLDRTKVTLERVAELKQALSACQIISDFTDEQIAAAIEKMGPDRRAALLALTAGGEVCVVAEGFDANSPVTKAADLPPWEFKLNSAYFPPTANLTKEQFADFCATMMKTESKTLHNLGIRVAQLTDDWLPSLQGLTVNELGLAQTSVTDVGLLHLRGVKIGNALALQWTAVTDEGVQSLASSIPSIPAIHLEGTKITDAALRALRALNLVGLNVSDTAITNEGLEYVAVHRRLKSLDMRACPQVGDEGMRHLSELTALELLEIRGSSVTDNGLQHLKKLTNLRVLGLPGNDKVTDAGMAIIDSFPQLTGLNLHGLRIGEPTISRIAKLQHLEQLEMSGATIVDVDLSVLSAVQQLHILALNGSNVTDVGIAHLETMPQLQKVYLEGAKVTLEGVARLKRARPDCQITSDFTGEQIATAVEKLKNE